MSFSINLDQADVVNEVFGVMREEKRIQSDRGYFITTAGVGGDPTIAAIAT